ncbi:hypothetical protein GCM10027258_88390 [Amycolatopsis stemonae]
MFPVSGAWPLMASGARSRLQPDSSAIAAYSSCVSPDSAGRNRVPQLLGARLRLQPLDDRRDDVVVRARGAAVRQVLGLRREDPVPHERQHPLLQLAGARRRGGKIVIEHASLLNRTGQWAGPRCGCLTS